MHLHERLHPGLVEVPGLEAVPAAEAAFEAERADRDVEALRHGVVGDLGNEAAACDPKQFMKAVWSNDREASETGTKRFASEGLYRYQTFR